MADHIKLLTQGSSHTLRAVSQEVPLKGRRDQKPYNKSCSMVRAETVLEGAVWGERDAYLLDPVQSPELLSWNDQQWSTGEHLTV